jgi:hypothetical protein
MSAVAYKNRNTGQVVAFPGRNPRLEALEEWERVDTGAVTYAVADAHDRAAAERKSIEAAAAIRLDTAVGAAAAGIAASNAVNTAQGGDGQPAPLPTLSTSDAGEKQNLVKLLDKGDELRKAATTSFEENKRLADQEILHPPRGGVLARAKADHKSGATQIGDNPEAHAGPRAAAARGDETGTKAADTTTSGDSTGAEAPVRAGRPADSANKAEWVDYAITAFGVERLEAESKTKQVLIDTYGG